MALTPSKQPDLLCGAKFGFHRNADAFQQRRGNNAASADDYSIVGQNYFLAFLIDNDLVSENFLDVRTHQHFYLAFGVVTIDFVAVFDLGAAECGASIG